MKPAAPVDVDHGDPIVTRLAQVMRQVGHVATAARAIVDAPDDAALALADAEFHEALLRAADNPAINFFADALAGPLRVSVSKRIVALRRAKGWRELMDRVHRDIHLAIASGDPARAARAVDDHFAAFDKATGTAAS